MLLLSSLLLLSLTNAFSLDTNSEYWSYTTGALANTTSQACKKAYSAEIACDEYLVALVSAGETRAFLPYMEFSNFTDTCTKTCHDSLTSYIHNVEGKCSEDTDAALKGVGKWGEMEFKNIPVVTVGRIFEYMLMRSCAEDENGENCYITQSSVIPITFDCSWSCAIAYRYNQHEYPYSEWAFGNEYAADVYYGKNGRSTVTDKYRNILTQHAVLQGQMDTAWNTASECLAGNGTFKTGIKGVEIGADADAAVKAASTAESSADNTSESSDASGASSNGTSSTSTGPEDGAAANVRVVGWVTLLDFVLSLAFLV
ncbi:uncharacterized protein DSM5745_10288 [Aspergillus mulundensis]|uniref:Uncharacterized protein n=1 Tax=Aspergillus mulundensis TaxID=1810919 RepID=A0A3D8QN04_9EURO|nr:hypothetical protein DSM5745_10288 [Aspergillus mulundensis]RDW63177.1 hypothetical protein DSM5745_10288 [Aspergillus mulundensis]